MEIGTRIQELRKKKNISQEELANVMNISRQAVSKWESNLSAPDIEKIIDLCEYFQVSADYLLMGKETSKKLEGSWIEFYPIGSLVIKLILMISLYFVADLINGLTGTIVYMVFVVLIYLLEKKLIQMYSLNTKTMFYELGFIFYSFPFIYLLRSLLMSALIKLIKWLPEFVLSLHYNTGLLNSPYKDMYRNLKSFKETFFGFSWFPKVFSIFIFVIVNVLIIRYIRKNNKE